MAKIIKLILNIIFIIFIVFLAAYLVLRTTDKIEIYRVKTGSMEEKIHVGDYILIYRKNSYNVGEVVTYTSNDGFITHRIIRKNGNRVITKGDANNAEDREISASTIVGEAILVGGILNFVINYKYVIVCVLLSLYLFSCYFGDDKKDKNTEENSDEADIKSNGETKESIKEEIINSEDKEIIEDNKLEKEFETEKIEPEEKNESIDEKKDTEDKEKIGEVVEAKEEIKKDIKSDNEDSIKKKYSENNE